MRMKREQTSRLRLQLVLLIGVVLFTGCASNGSVQGAGSGEVSNSEAAGQTGFVELAARGGDNLDEDPIVFNSLDAMLERTDVAVVGKVASIRPGRSIAVGRSDLNTFTFELAVDQVLYGDVKPGEVLVFEWYLDSAVSQDEVASVAPGERLLIGGRFVPVDVEGARRQAESLYGDSTEVLFPWNQAFIAETAEGEVIDAGSTEPASSTALFGELSFEETVVQAARAIEEFRASAGSAVSDGQ